MKDTTIVFMGTPDFAVPSLKKLIEEFKVKAVFTQPDRPKGRGKKLAMSAVKEVALENSIEVYQPIKLKNDEICIKKLKEINPDFIIVVAFGQILSKEVLDIPKYGCINLHASLLPKYRGAAPINWAIIKGEKESGNTTMFMDEGLDTGDMLLKNTVKIENDMTAGELHDILMESGSELLVSTIKGLKEGTIKREKQKAEDIIYASMLNKQMAKIDWNKTSKEINLLIRGLNPWPVAYTQYKNEIMKIYSSSILKESSNKNPGTILNVSKEDIKVVTGDGVLSITTVQFPGKKPMKVEEYIKGHTIEEGLVLGE
ncbi:MULTISPECIES: methionyl-tRNA formyltransferase [Clostridium]|nr:MULTISPECIES: methionyl-tRNA formyltransferase [Clostridium]STC81174.1 methionyl-tRNA formyltransferase [Clostridium botulinum]MBA4507994.1 methionyl-tRNA formyltransferase [Clostridium sporogenes]MBE6056203.1 methionyl-tRNA formyltransferase [Clostridium sp.]MCW6087349.1 methionyl-tRNA formyltransferase [Clostridium sporogenes]MDS1007065.1 methionyl-tRNA formyltransferase [Clostridium sporogenes]